jgi:signal transduction histidine kinase
MLVDRPRTASAIATFVASTANWLGQGRVTVRARGAEAAGIGQALTITVDPSRALSPGEATRALEPFGPWPGDGLGLALPLARRILELQGGRVEVTESQGRAAFVLSLPVGNTVYRRSQHLRPPARA